MIANDSMVLLNQPAQLQQLYHLRQLAYRVEAQRLGVKTLPPLQRSIADLVAEPDSHLGIFHVHQLIGAISFTEHLINSLVVHPDFFRQGIASRLLTDVLTSNDQWCVTTGANNLPAIGLYEKYGFRIFKRFEVPGLQLVELRTTNN